MVFGGTRRRASILAFVALASATATSADAAAAPRKKKPAAPAAAAAPPASSAASDRSRAAELYKKSADAYLHGDFGLAIKLLDEAYALDPQPVLVYNQARAHEGLGHVDEAITLYEKYLAEEPTSPDRGAIEQRLTTLHKQKEEKLRLEKEKADVETTREQQEQQQRDLAKREEEIKTAPDPRKRSPFPYIVAGVGAAGLVTGTVFGFLAKNKEESGNSASSLRDATDAQDSGQTFATVSNVSFIVGGVLLAGGVVWWIVDGGRSSGSSKTGAAKRPLLLGNGIGGTF
jgi:tetratricopeptide (TPR) repeat protein